MATIFYSMCGEGRGHATRVQAVTDMFIPQHRFVLLAARDAYDQLYSQYQDHPLVSVRRLPGLFFSYRNQRVDYVRSLTRSLPYLWNLSARVRYVRRMMEREKPSLAITDFEPLLPRAANQLRLPWISLDHQHFLSVSEFRSVPQSFRLRGWFLRCSIPLFYRGQIGEAVSSFFHLPPRKGTESVSRLGVLLRKSIIDAKSSAQGKADHVLVYIRKYAPEPFLQALTKINRPVILYGLGAQLRRENIEFKEFGNESFARDLAQCECLITTAGNQIVGESFYLGKPVLAIPEEGNFEQELNALLVARSQGGWSTTFRKVTPHLLKQFLLAVPAIRAQLDELEVNGNEKAKRFIERFLPEADLAPAIPFAHDERTSSFRDAIPI